MTIPLSIFEATPDDWEALLAIYQLDKYQGDLQKAAEHIKWDFEQIGKDRKIFYAVSDGKKIGSIQLVFDNPQKDLANGKDIAYLHHFRVTRAFHGLGVASFLAKHAEEIARKKGVVTITLEVEKTNTKAQGIYKHWGYVYFRESINGFEFAMKKVL